MRSRTLLVLFAVVAGLGAFIWFFEREMPSTDERAEQSKLLLRLDERRILAMVLTFGERQLRLERVGVPGEEKDDGVLEGGSDEWVLTQPLRSRADSAAVTGFLGSLRQLEKQRTLEAGSREALGLDAPRAQIEIETASDVIVVRFGGQIPTSSNTIVEVGDGPPFYVVEGSLLDDVAQGPDAWRSRDAIPVEAASIERIEVLNPPTGVVLERSNDGFRLTDPVQDLADETKVAKLLGALTELEVEEFVDQAEGVWDGEPAALRLTIIGEKEPLLVEVDRSSPVGDLATVRVAGQVFKCETELASLIETAPADWRSSSWLDGNVYEIESFRLVHGALDNRFERRDGEWWLGDSAIDTSLASAFLRALFDASGAPIESVVIDKGNLPIAEIELEAGARHETLRLWADSEGSIAERSGRLTMIRLDPESTETFLAKLQELDTAAAPEPGLTKADAG